MNNNGPKKSPRKSNPRKKRLEKKPHSKKISSAPKQRSKDARRSDLKRPSARRKSLSNLGGSFRTWGDPEIVKILRKSFIAAGDKDADELTHLFHTYPARMHPWMARILIRELSEKELTILDPFCGSGTVPLETMISERKSIAVDLNPIAIRLSQTKCFIKTRQERKLFLATLHAVAEKSYERIQSRVHSEAPLKKDQLQFYPPQTLKEFAGLLEEIETVDPLWMRRAFEMIISSMVYKFSFRRSDSSPEKVDRKIRKGLPTDFFIRKGKELERRWQKVEKQISGKKIFPTETYLGNALWLSKVLPEHTKVDRIITSPPYGGTYDYHHHHDLRFAWLKLSSRSFEEEELGSKRKSEKETDPCENWNRQMMSFFKSARKVLKPDGKIILVIGDGQFGSKRIFSEKQIPEIARRVGFSTIAICSQKRVDWTNKGSRYEHCIVLEPNN